MKTNVGTPILPGATWRGHDWNFAIFSPQIITHLVIQEYEGQNEIASIPLQQSHNKTGAMWHIAVQGLPKRFLWGWRIKTEEGDRLALDPYAHILYTGSKWGNNRWKASRESGEDLLYAVAAEPVPFQWSAPSPTVKPHTDQIIYETHVRGFTNDPSSEVSFPGTWSGYIEKLDYLQELGVSSLELLPIYEFDETEWPRTHPKTKEPLYNFWGYSPLHFFSPMQRYSSFSDPIEATLEFKKFINECHKRSLSVILDVVYNHTGEGNEQGPAYSFKLLAEDDYYIKNEKNLHTNFSGCGNSFNTNNPVSRRLIVDSLKHWVEEYKIDGFRLDLAGSFLRGMNGEELPFSPLLQEIAHEPLLQSKLLILEPWDPSGIYKTSSLFREGLDKAYPLWEWNDRFRDDIRRFIRGDQHKKGLFATRLAGSEDMYFNPLKQTRSINFITCHDGFSLDDLVTYSKKNNWDNAEDNRDGTNDNFSSNCGIEGETTQLPIRNLRKQQLKNFFLALLTSHGLPMIHQGDEYGHSKKGNNNSWCQDNRINWFQWDTCKKQKELVTFVQKLIHYRKKSSTLRSLHFLKECDIDWHGILPFLPEWDMDDNYIGFSAKQKQGLIEFYVGFSPSDKKRTITLPNYEGGCWHLFLSSHTKTTSLVTSNKAPEIQKIHVAPFSSFLLTWH